MLPRERNFVRATTLAASLRQMFRHLREPRLLATFAVGFGIMFNFIAAFTFIGFVLAAPPFQLSATAIGLVFVVYLSSLVTTPYTGRLVARFGRRNFGLMAIAAWICGILLTLVPSLPAIVGGLMIAAASGFYVQTCCQSFVATHAKRRQIVGDRALCHELLYRRPFGGLIPGLLWNITGWQGTVALVVPC